MTNQSLNSILGLCLWIVLSFLFPLGILGNIIFRKIVGINLKEKIWTYFLSIIPLVGPIISYIVLEN